MGAIETMMIDAAYAQVGKHLGLPTHAYMALSDAKTPDYQAGFESATGALVAAASGINLVSGAGMLDFESCQSLEKLVLDSEACEAALRAVRGIDVAELTPLVEVIRDGVASEQFLNLDHTRQHYRAEHRFPGPTIDRSTGDDWVATGSPTANDRAHDEVVRLLELEGAAPLDETVAEELRELAGVAGPAS